MMFPPIRNRSTGDVHVHRILNPRGVQDGSAIWATVGAIITRLSGIYYGVDIGGGLSG